MRNVGLVVFAFGCPSTIYSNEVLAAMADAWWNDYGGPIYTQEDINLKNRGMHRVAYIRQLPDKPPPTLKIAREAMYWARDQRLRELHVLAASPHIQRCLRDLMFAKQEQRTLITLAECQSPNRIRYEEWFCPNSTQPRTRSAAAWERRERIVRHLPVWLYKLVAS